MQLDDYTVTWYGLAPLATAVGMLLLGVFVVWRERGSRESVLFGVLAVTVTVWLGCFSAMYLANAEPVARIWAKTAYLGITFIPPAVLSFAVAVTRDWQRRRRLVAASWLLSALLCAASVGTDALFRGLERYPWGYYPRFRWLGVPFLGVFFAQLGFALRQYWIDYRAATSATHRQRARWLLVAFSIAYLGCIDYVPAYGVALYPFGYAPVFLFIVLSAWTIRRFRLVDFTPELAAHEILATVADPLIVCDGEGRVRLLNPAAASVLDRRPEEIVGRPIADLVPPPERERLAAATSPAMPAMPATCRASAPAPAGPFMRIEARTLERGRPSPTGLASHRPACVRRPPCNATPFVSARRRRRPLASAESFPERTPGRL